MIIRLCALLVFVFVFSPASADQFMGTPLSISSPRVNHGWFYDDGLLHRGIDYRAAGGTPIYAVADGYAISTDHRCYVDPTRSDCEGLRTYNYGRFVMIVHDNGKSSIYAHLSASMVPALPFGEFVSSNYRSWTRVVSGQLIGFSGTTGTTTNHLHLDIAENPSGTYSGHYNGKKDPYDIYSGPDHYPPSGRQFASCGSDHNWIPSDQTCPPPPPQVVSASFEGTVSSISAFGATDYPNIRVGDRITGTYNLNLATPESAQTSSDPNFGLYFDAVTNVEIRVGPYRFSERRADEVSIRNNDNRIGMGTVDLYGIYMFQNVQGRIGSWTPLTFVLQLVDPTASRFSSVAIPSTAPSPTGFRSSNTVLRLVLVHDFGGTFFVDATFDRHVW